MDTNKAPDVQMLLEARSHLFSEPMPSSFPAYEANVTKAFVAGRSEVLRRINLAVKALYIRLRKLLNRLTCLQIGLKR